MDRGVRIEIAGVWLGIRNLQIVGVRPAVFPQSRQPEEFGMGDHKTAVAGDIGQGAGPAALELGPAAIA